MADNATILMRLLGVKTESKGIFFHRVSRIVLDGECGADEVLCAVRKDGKEPYVVEVGKSGVFADGKAPADGELLFAVRRTPFPFDTTIESGTDADNNKWSFGVNGDVEILKPEVFAKTFRGKVTDEGMLSVEAFKTWLGTRPATVMHREVIVKVLGVPSLQDKVYEDGQGNRYVDMQYRLEESKEVGEKCVANALAKVFADSFGDDSVVSMGVRSFRAFSADREAKLAADEKHDAEVRKQAHDIAALQHDLEIARLNNDKAKIEADTEALNAKVKKLMDSAEALDKLMNMNFAAGTAPDLGKLLAIAGKEDAVGRILDAVDSSMRGDSHFTMELEPRERGIGPRLRPMKQGHLYGLSIEKVPRDGYLTVFDICDDNDVVPVVPCSDAKTKSTFVRAASVSSEQPILIGAKSSPWIVEPFQQYENSGKDRFVAFITDEPLLKAEESVRFGDDLRPETIQLVADRLSALNQKDICGGLLQVRIEADR